MSLGTLLGLSATIRDVKPVRYPFDPDKARAAAEVLLHLGGGRMEFLRLVKLLYLAERESLGRRGAPLFGGRLACWEHGPVPTDAQDLVKASAGVAGASRLTMRGYSVVLEVEPNAGPLSDWELELLGELTRLHEGDGTWDLVVATHQLDEWRRPPTGSSLAIDAGDVLRALGRSPADVEQLAAEAAELEYMRGLGLW